MYSKNIIWNIIISTVILGIVLSLLANTFSFIAVIIGIVLFCSLPFGSIILLLLFFFYLTKSAIKLAFSLLGSSIGLIILFVIFFL